QSAQGGRNPVSTWVRRPVCMENLEAGLSPHETWVARQALIHSSNRVLEANNGLIDAVWDMTVRLVRSLRFHSYSSVWLTAKCSAASRARKPFKSDWQRGLLQRFLLV